MTNASHKLDLIKTSLACITYFLPFTFSKDLATGTVMIRLYFQDTSCITKIYTFQT